VFVVCSAIAAQLAVAPVAHALDGHRGISQYAQTRFEAQHGLAHNLVNSIAQTPDGYLWAGSEEGLNRYDGVSFTTFDHRKTEGIPSNTFSALAVDHGGTLWAGTRDHGVLRLVDGQFTAVLWEPGAQSAQIRALTTAPDGDMWVGLHDRGVVLLHGTTVVGTVTVRDGLPSDDIRSILVARDGTMWIATFRGLAQWSAGRVLRGPAALDGVAIDEVVQDAHGELWCATANGLAHVRGDGVEWVGGQRVLAMRVRQLLFDHDGNLWIGTGSGVARMTPDRQIDLLPKPVGMVLALFEDSEGDVWIGTEGGLDRLRDGDLIPIGAPQGATSDIAMTVRGDPSGAMWIGGDAGLFRLAPGAANATKVADDHGTMFGIYPDHRGDVWFGARDGSVGRWHDGAFAWIGRRPWERVRTFTETGDTMWIGTDNGLFRMRGDRLEDAEPVLAGIAVSAITPDPTSGLWLATESGVMRWRDGAFLAIPPGGPPSNTSATTIQFDADGTMWVTTEGAGLWRLRGGRWFGFGSKDGLFDDLVWRVLDDGLGNFWLSSNRGISMVRRKQLEDLAAGLRTSVDYVLYGEGDGMPSRECDGSMDPAGWRSADGRLWFPTVKGVVVIDPAHLHRNPPADALIDSVRVDGQLQRGARPLDLAPGVSRLEIVYTAPALRNPDRLRFRYRLVGFDVTWNDAGGQRVAQYTNLAPGTYRFVVQAGRDGAWGRVAEQSITLQPHFYQTRGFTALAIALGILAVIAVPLLRIRQLRVRERELAERIREAIRELAEREQKLRDMQAQLVEASRQAGRSDVATAVLHNVGNVLNSVNVSASLINDIVGRLKTANLSRVAALITDHRDDLARFFRDDNRGQKLPEYFTQLQEVLERDKAAALAELKALMRNLDHIKIVVSSQQTHVKTGGLCEVFEVRQLLDDAIKLAPGSRVADAIEIVREVDDLPPVRLDRHKALQVLVNLLANARDAVMTRPGPRRIAVSARRGPPGQFEILVEDNGCGLDPANVEKIFQHGFTTKPTGNGLGLHYSACAALELHGKLTAESAGIDRGATFKLVLPLEAAVAAAA
jgi:ligand-binding sensor domain-containing protein/signal transduction histidine kinase